MPKRAAGRKPPADGVRGGLGVSHAGSYTDERPCTSPDRREHRAATNPRSRTTRHYEDVLGRPPLVLSRSNRVLTLPRILLGTDGSPLPGGERGQWKETTMPADPTAKCSGNHSKRCLTLATSAQLNGKRGRVMRICPRRSTSLAPIRVVSHHARRWPTDRTRDLAPSISLIRVIAEGSGS